MVAEAQASQWRQIATEESPDTEQSSYDVDDNSELAVSLHEGLSENEREDVQASNESKSHRWGVVIVLISAFLFSGMHIGARISTTTFSISPIFVASYRGLTQFILAALAICLVGSRRILSVLTTKTLWMLFLRGVWGAISSLCKYYALSKLPVGICSALFATTPIFAALIGRFFIGERLTRHDLISLSLCMSGTILVGVSSPTHSPVASVSYDHVLGVSAALLAAFCTASVYVLIRSMGAKVHFLLSVVSLGIMAMITPILLKLIQDQNPLKTAAFFSETFTNSFSQSGPATTLVCVSLFSFCAASFLNRGLQLIPAGKTATLRTLDIPINFLTGFLVLGENPDTITQVVGSLLIAIGAYVIAVKGKS